MNMARASFVLALTGLLVSACGGRVAEVGATEENVTENGNTTNGTNGTDATNPDGTPHFKPRNCETSKWGDRYRGDAPASCEMHWGNAEHYASFADAAKRLAGRWIQCPGGIFTDTPSGAVGFEIEDKYTEEDGNAYIDVHWLVEDASCNITRRPGADSKSQVLLYPEKSWAGDHVVAKVGLRGKQGFTYGEVDGFPLRNTMLMGGYGGYAWVP